MHYSTNTPNSLRIPHGFFRGGGNCGEIFRGMNWENHPLGPTELWPGSLKTSLGILFHSLQPTGLFWGEECFFFYNDGCVPLLGQGSPPPLLGANGTDAWEKIWPGFQRQIKLTIKDGRAFCNEDLPIPVPLYNGKREGFFTYSCSPVFQENGVAGGALVNFTDTTARVIAERKLIEGRDQLRLAMEMSELERKRFESIFENSPAMLVLLRGPHFVYEKVNPAYQRVTGVNPVGKTVRDIISPQKIDYFLEILEKVYRTGKSEHLREVPVKPEPSSPGAPTRYFDISYARVSHGHARAYSIYACAIEITDRVLENLKQRELQQKL